ncbi:unnamed protein product [Ambrosiozyma monospora]|uniref:Unnamed protein product n=1 Tax=Ambrosiozyma monospora TaxID=43982 RepID=A0A9W6T991_AMBMO|nr:unnamed protein product [Ambrosiozyma monospora]
MVKCSTTQQLYSSTIKTQQHNKTTKQQNNKTTKQQNNKTTKQQNNKTEEPVSMDQLQQMNQKRTLLRHRNKQIEQVEAGDQYMEQRRDRRIGR